MMPLRTQQPRSIQFTTWWWNPTRERGDVDQEPARGVREVRDVTSRGGVGPEASGCHQQSSGARQRHGVRICPAQENLSGHVSERAFVGAVVAAAVDADRLWRRHGDEYRPQPGPLEPPRPDSVEGPAGKDPEDAREHQGRGQCADER